MGNIKLGLCARLGVQELDNKTETLWLANLLRLHGNQEQRSNLQNLRRHKNYTIHKR